MEKEQMKRLFSNTKKRTNRITMLVLLSILFCAISINLIVSGINSKVNYYIHYDEKSDLDYKVYLKENEYFGKFLGKDKQYIANLIDYVEANFKYKFSMGEQINYTYYYYIEAETLVLDYNDKVLYQKKDILLPKKECNDLENYSFEINEVVNLDYNYYNDIINTFISRYDLTNTKNSVNLKMYVGIEGDCKEFVSSVSDNAVITMTIPLSKHTVNVDMNYKLNSGTDKLLECKKKTSIFENHRLISGIVILIVVICIVTYLIVYIKRTRNASTLYNKFLKKIFNNYGRYISKIKTEMNLDSFQVVFVEQFEDLFEIRNSSNSPILFYQNEEKTESAFFVPTNSGLLYAYYFSISNIKGEQMNDGKHI